MDYIREYSAGQLIKAAVSIAFRRFFRFLLVFLPVWLLYFLLILASIAAQSVIGRGGAFVLTVASLLVSVVLFFGLLPAAMTILTSDIVLGNRPSVIRAYRRAFGRATKLIGTAFLQLMYVFLWSLVFLVPGVMRALWYALSPIVVVMEGSSPSEALERSKSLSQGYRGRVLGLMLLFTFCGVYLPLIIQLLLQAEMGQGSQAGAAVLLSLVALLGSLALSLLGVSSLYVVLVLMYYDLRVRKEAYDIAALSEDLMR